MCAVLVIALVMPQRQADVAQSEDTRAATEEVAQAKAEIDEGDTVAQPDAPDVEPDRPENLPQGADATDPIDHPRPTIDEVRLESDGVLVVAGRAVNGDRVAVLVDGDEIGAGVADSSGAFAAVGFLDPSGTARILSLVATNAAGSFASEDEVILAPRMDTSGTDLIAKAETETDQPSMLAQPASPPDQSDPAEEAEEFAAPREGSQKALAPAPDTPDTASLVAVDPPEVETETASETEPSAEAESVVARSKLRGADLPSADSADRPAQSLNNQGSDTAATLADDPAPEVLEPDVALLKSTQDGVRLLEPRLTEPDSIALDTIGYSDSGVVQLSGRASAEAREIRVYLDNRPVAELQLSERGDWRGEVPDVRTGIYTLRVDAIDAEGQVTSRVETPFKREAPAVLAAASAGQSGAIRAVTVQTGDTLWAIARDRYGEGVLYVRVFDANRAAIGDPDLIYPGQVFDLPEN